MLLFCGMGRMLHIPNQFAAYSIQPETIIALDNGKGEVPQKDHHRKDNIDRERIDEKHHYRAKAVGQMHPFSPAGFHNKLIQIFQRKGGDMAFGKTVFGDKLGNFILPQLNFQVIPIPTPSLFPAKRLIPLSLAVKKAAGKTHTSNKYDHMPTGYESHVPK